MNESIICTNLHKEYEGFALECSLSIPPGTVTGLVGCNGAGKSTLFKLLLGLIRKDGGRAALLGEDISSLPVSVKAQIGCVFSDAGFQEGFTPADIKKILAAFYSSFDEDLYDSLLARLEIPTDKKLSNFSTGMLARFRMSAALAHKPRVLFLDEPTAGLDVIGRNVILDLIRAFMEEDGSRTVLISSHNARDLESLCDDFYFIDQGKILLHETIEALQSDYGLVKANPGLDGQIGSDGVLARLARPYGFDLLVKDRKYIQENWPHVQLDHSSIDDLISIMVKGERL